MTEKLIGLIPAAGLAKRVSPLPGSKELFPIGFREMLIDDHLQLRPKVVSQYLLDNMFSAGVRKVWFVLGRGKSDIMHYYGDGRGFGGNIAYLFMDRMWGMPYTLDQAYPWLDGDTVLFGMPDTIFMPFDAFKHILVQHRESATDITLGIFPTNQPEKLCPVELDTSGKVMGMTDKPEHSDIKNTWGCACWSPRFTEFMHQYLAQLSFENREVVLASVFRAAITAGLGINGCIFEDGDYNDIGTPEDLARAVRRFSQW